jgi:hypothetical protein
VLIPTAHTADILKGVALEARNILDVNIEEAFRFEELMGHTIK